MAEKYAFLHIGKTGGTAFMDAAAKHNEMGKQTHVRHLGHGYSLRRFVDEKWSADLFFFVREPVSRFVSGFNSRLRKGRFGERQWTDKEQETFALFKTPNELAEALSSNVPELRKKAMRGIRNIRHLRKSLNAYIGPIDLLKEEKQRILYIGNQITLAEDFEILKPLLKFDESLSLPTDDRDAHRAPDDMDRALSPEGEANLRKFYQLDFPIYEWCLEYRNELINRYISEGRIPPARTD